MVLVDSHCHLFDIKNYSMPPDILPVVCGYSHSTNRKAAEFAKKGYPVVMGIAPQTSLKEGVSKLDEWAEFIRQSRPKAIGETGLDYKWAQTEEDVGKELTVFQRMIGLAREMDLPLVIHSRNNPNENQVPKDAIEDILGRLGGMRFAMHFYSGSEEQAQRIVAQGGYISVMHLRTKERRKVINSVPLDRLLVESDAPFVGRTPESIREAIAYIAEVKGLSAAEIGKATAENAAGFFGFEL